ncbi:MAG: DNA-binding protein [Rhodospirillales bacterium]|nr:MAG: DNA-binding protein [Rhodospirillales bacterium]
MPHDAVNTSQPFEIVDTAGAEAIVGLSASTLEKKRCTGGGPPFVKYGKAVRYRVADLRAWAAAHVVTSTSARPAPEIAEHIKKADKSRRSGGRSKRGV